MQRAVKMLKTYQLDAMLAEKNEPQMPATRHVANRRLVRMPLTAKEAQCCCECKHWHKHGEKDGQCRNPELRVGITYKDTNTGELTYVEWSTTGCYHSCLKYEGREGHPNDQAQRLAANNPDA